MQSPAPKSARLRIYLLWPLLLAALLIFFPFDWLGATWPWFKPYFNMVFHSPTSHHIGHTTIFCVSTLLILYARPSAARPFLRFALLVLCCGIGEEAIQALFRQAIPTWWSALDIFYDCLGASIAYVIFLLWQHRSKTRSATAK